MKVAVDTNVVVSAVIADGPPRRVLEAIADGAAELVLPEPVPAELRRVLTEKLALDDASIETIIELLEELAPEPARVPDQVEAVCGDPDDDRILAAAVAAGAEILISGDNKHLLPLGQHRATLIIRPQEFLAEITG
ncbi:MAG: putative toxin-antitoxin system toxin component, PIN family [Solirubrobacterales bacterium]